jgi:hypothetical protein
VTEVVLQDAGYHQYKGEWRRCLNHDVNDSHDGLDALNSQGEPADHGNPCEGKGDGGEAEAREEMGVIYVVLGKAASPGTRREWEPVFRGLLRDHPELWRDPSGQAHDTALEVLRDGQARIAAGQLYYDSTFVLELANLQTELKYDQAQGLERLLIEQVLLAFMRHRLLQAYYREARVGIALAKRTVEWEKRIRQARRAYEQARRALERVRGLAARQRRPLRITD